MHDVIIAIGSNTNANETIKKAIGDLGGVINNIQPTRLLDNQSVDFVCDCTFTNALVKGTTTLSINELEEKLKCIETKHGRTKEQTQKGIVALDLDLLIYDKCKFRVNDWNRDYIKTLIKEIDE